MYELCFTNYDNIYYVIYLLDGNFSNVEITNARVILLKTTRVNHKNMEEFIVFLHLVNYVCSTISTCS